MPSIHDGREHPRGGARFGENCRRTKPSSDEYMLSHEEQHTIDVLPPTPLVLCVHGQGLTSLKHSQYTWAPFIKATQHPSYGTRFGEKNYKTTRLVYVVK